MNKMFNISDPFRIPDGTLISPFMNPMDSKGNLQSGLFKGLSIAAGIIEAGTSSKIHLTHFRSFLAELVEGGTVDRGEVESVAGYFRMY